nr:ribonuclease H-like domain-containing protein [Tanacetum cinerariifolium]
EKFQSSSKGLSKLLNSHMSAKDKSRLGSSDVEDSHVNDRFSKVEEMHEVPPPMTGNYMPPKSDFGIDDSSAETLKTVPKPIESKPKVVNEPKVWTDAPIIEEYDSDSDDEHVTIPSKEQEKPSFAFVNTVEHVKTPRQTAKEQNTCSQNPKPRKRDWNGLIQAASTSTARKVNIARPKVNEIKPRYNVYKSHSPIRRPFNKTTAPKANFVQHKVNTAGDKSTLKGKGIVDSGCFRHMTGNKAYLVDYQDFNGGHIDFRGSKGQITCKGKIQPGKLDFEDVYFVKEIQHFNLFYVSQMCDKKNKVLFTDTECLVLSPDFKLPDENQVLLRVPRQHNMYSFNLENIVPSGGLACLNAKATVDESTKWHRRLGHVNFKNLNILVKGNLVRGLPSTIFHNDHTCVACHKGKQTRPPAKVVSAACYVLNRVLVTKPQNKTPYELLTGNSKMEADHAQEYYVLPVWSFYTSTVKSSKAKNGDAKLNEDIDSKTNEEPVDQEDQAFLEKLKRLKRQEKEAHDAAETLRKSLEDIYKVSRNGIFTSASYDDEGAVANFTNLESTTNVNPIPTSKIHYIHPTTQILRDPTSAVQTRIKVNKSSGAYALNKKDERGVVVRNKARLVAQGHRKEEGIYYDELFAHVARIKAIKIFLAFASYMGFIVYQIDVKSAFLYDTINEEV